MIPFRGACPNRYDARSLVSGEAMARRDKTTGKGTKQRYKTSARRSAAKARRYIAGSSEKIASLERRLNESLEQQQATSEVLKAISQSFDLQSVFNTMAENVVKLCEAERGYIFRFDGKLLRLAASYNVGPRVIDFINRNPIAPDATALRRAPPSNGKQCMSPTFKVIPKQV